MALTKEQKQEIVLQYGKNEKNTGSTAAQIAMLSQRISELTEHLKTHKKDFACQRGLTMLVGQRRRLLNYYKDTQTPEAYRDLINTLGIRK